MAPPTPFVTSIEADFAWIEHRTHVRASKVIISYYYSSPSREFVRLKKVFSCIFRQCRPGVLLLDAAKQLKMGSVAMWSGPTYFPSLCSKHFRNTLHTLTWREKFFSKTWCHPSKFSSQDNRFNDFIIWMRWIFFPPHKQLVYAFWYDCTQYWLHPVLIAPSTDCTQYWLHPVLIAPKHADKQLCSWP